MDEDCLDDCPRHPAEHAPELKERQALCCGLDVDVCAELRVVLLFVFLLFLLGQGLLLLLRWRGAEGWEVCLARHNLLRRADVDEGLDGRRHKLHSHELPAQALVGHGGVHVRALVAHDAAEVLEVVAAHAVVLVQKGAVHDTALVAHPERAHLARVRQLVQRRVLFPVLHRIHHIAGAAQCRFIVAAKVLVPLWVVHHCLCFVLLFFVVDFFVFDNLVVFPFRCCCYSFRRSRRWGEARHKLCGEEFVKLLCGEVGQRLVLIRKQVELLPAARSFAHDVFCVQTISKKRLGNDKQGCRRCFALIC